MPNHFDRIFRESFAGAFLKMVERWLKLEIGAVSDLPGKLQRTAEREPDFLKLVENKNGDRFILHLEIQTSNDPKMLERMRTYHALLAEKYLLRVKQIVIYVGRAPATMRSRFEEDEVMHGYLLQDVARMDFREFLESELMEEIIFAVLADPGEDGKDEIVKLILEKLYEIGGDGKDAHRAIQQLLILSRISKLDKKIENELKYMPFTIDIAKDRLYKRGKRQGILEGERKGKIEGKIEGKLEVALNMLREGKFSLEEISRYTSHSAEEILAYRDEAEKINKD